MQESIQKGEAIAMKWFATLYATAPMVSPSDSRRASCFIKVNAACSRREELNDNVGMRAAKTFMMGTARTTVLGVTLKDFVTKGPHMFDIVS